MSQNKTIQDKMQQLNGLVEWFDSDDFVLEEAVAKFQVAEKLAAEIEADLVSMKNDIQVIREKFDGNGA